MIMLIENLMIVKVEGNFIKVKFTTYNPERVITLKKKIKRCCICNEKIKELCGFKVVADPLSQKGLSLKTFCSKDCVLQFVIKNEERLQYVC